MRMDLERMATLSPASVRYIVLHTADYDGPNCDVEMINRWHTEDNGWAGIGYHFVITNARHRSIPEGTVQIGRPLDKRGSHVKGINHMSIGICCVGKGDRDPFSERQMDTLLPLLQSLMARFGVPVEGVIGHREVNRLIDQGLVPARDSDGKSNRTGKTCPGTKVDMDALRERLRTYLALEAMPMPEPGLAGPSRPQAPEPRLDPVNVPPPNPLA